VIAILLALIPAILMAPAVVREKELGSVTNLYVTPVAHIEFILGKQVPYIAMAMINFVCLVAMAALVFDVPAKGSFAALSVGALIYVTTTTAYGLLISAFATRQIAALFATAILTVLPGTQFCGMLAPVSSLSGTAAVMGRAFPTDVFPADQYRGIHQKPWVRRTEPEHGSARADPHRLSLLSLRK
jgi:ribosome-dependent ATPase